MRPSRRSAIGTALRLALAGWGAARAPRRAFATSGFAADPFALGVASGCPEHDSVVLWTRLAPMPQRPDGGLDPQPVAVRWEVAEDEGFTRVVRSGETAALPERAHAVHVEADGLAPSRWYWYRFVAGTAGQSARSPAGRTRTAPAPGAPAQRLAFAFASCQHYERGFYAAWRHLVDESPELIVHLGDYIYESNLRRDPVRRHWNEEPTTLEGYRLRHAQYRTDPDLQRAHAAAPWLVTWDDHEVDNDYADDRAQDLAPGFLARRAAAYRAYFEHMPLRALAAPAGPDMRLFGRWRFGDLAQFHLLDCRQYRSHQACPRPGRGGSNVVVDCAELAEPQRTMLGAAQERWLDLELRASRARWNVLAQSTLFARFDLDPGPGTRYWTDGWSGYPAAADRLVRSIVDSRASNPLLIGGDVHTHYVANVLSDFGDPRSKVVATEFCGTSITSPGQPQVRVDVARMDNPHLLLGDGTRRGYVSVVLEPDRCTAHLRVIDDPRDPNTPLATRASFVVESGRPGAQPA